MCVKSSPGSLNTPDVYACELALADRGCNSASLAFAGIPRSEFRV